MPALALGHDECLRVYAAGLRGLRNRLALLVPWLPGQPSSVLTLEQGVDYRLREDRNVCNPVDWARDVSQYHRYDPGGLKGGVDWGIESQNILDELNRDPVSHSGRIVGPSFTALGGQGFQEARFAGEKTRFFSDTFLGRTFFYSVERVGRIGVLWHPARHIVVFERSVVESLQFPDQTPQRQWEGYAVVRKTQDFIRIDRPNRSYPDSDAPPSARGFVLEARFLSTTIPVDSRRWGRDINIPDPNKPAESRPVGWAVPLFNPSVVSRAYPFPEIVLKLATSQQTKEPFVWGRLLNPEALVFYTATPSGAPATPIPEQGINTDAWSPVPGIDYPPDNLPVRPDAGLPAIETEEGYERFTYRVDTGGRTVNLLHDRRDATTEAHIRNVTLARRALTMVAKRQRPPEYGGLTGLALGRDAFTGSLGGTFREAAGRLGDKDLAGALAALDRFAQGNDFDRLADPARRLQTTVVGDVQQWLAKTQADIKTQFDHNWDRVKAAARQQVVDALQRLQQPAGEVRRALESLRGELAAARTAVDEVANAADRAVVAVESLRGEIDDVFRRFQVELIAALPAGRQAYARAVVSVAGRIDAWGRSLDRTVGPFLPGLYTTLLKVGGDTFPGKLKDLTAKLLAADVTVQAVNTAIEPFRGELKDALGALKGSIESDPVYQQARQWVNKAQEVVAGAFTDEQLGKYQAQLTQLVQSGLPASQAELAKIAEEFDKVAGSIEAQVKDAVDRQVFRKVSEFIGDAHSKASLERWIGPVQAKALEDSVKAASQQAVDAARAILRGLQPGDVWKDFDVQRALGDYLGSVAPGVGRAFSPFDRAVQDRLRELEGDLLKTLPGAAANDARAVGDTVMRLARAYGMPPVAQALEFAHDRLAYYFHAVEGDVQRVLDQVHFTPTTALLSQGKESIESLGLKTLGLTIPTFALTDRFVPNLGDLTAPLQSVVRNIAGMDIASLFSFLKIPEGAPDGIRLTHGFDPTTTRPWAQCDLDFPLGAETTVFQIGPLAVKLRQGRFEAHSRIAVDPRAGMAQKQVNARVDGDWVVSAGADIVTFRRTALLYNNDGKLDFPIGPSNVQIHPPLDFLADLLKSFPAPRGSGISLEVIRGGGSIPMGVRALLNLAIPPIQTGAFAISHLDLHGFFELSVQDGFQIGAGVGLASRERPFTLTILFLGGGGWFDLAAFYKLGQGLTSRLQVGIAVGATFEFDIGVASGGVYFFVGADLSWTFASRGGGHLTIALRVSLAGEVVILGIVSVSLLLELDALYSEGTLECRGILALSIKICWCFSISVHQEVHFVLAHGSGAPAGNVTLDGPAPFRRGSLIRDLDDPTSGHLPLRRTAMAYDPVPGAIPLKTIQDAVHDYLACFGG